MSCEMNMEHRLPVAQAFSCSTGILACVFSWSIRNTGKNACATRSCKESATDASYVWISRICVARYHWLPNASFTLAVRSP
jgi:hypothetical protein